MRRTRPPKPATYNTGVGEIVGLLVREPCGAETVRRMPTKAAGIFEAADALGALLKWFPTEIADKREHFMALYLDARRRVIDAQVISTGTLTCSLVHPRELYRPALLCSAECVIVAHNHPSGDPDPSADDIALTRRLDKAANILNLRLLDHIVVTASGEMVSLRERQRAGRLPIEVFSSERWPY